MRKICLDRFSAHEYPAKMDSYCGAYICIRCGDHRRLARCYCGWSVSGGDGLRELIDMGETIEPDEEVV